VERIDSCEVVQQKIEEDAAANKPAARPACAVTVPEQPILTSHQIALEFKRPSTLGHGASFSDVHVQIAHEGVLRASRVRSGFVS